MKATSTHQAVSDPSPSAAAPESPPSAADLHVQIAERAYLRAQQRDFAPGQELDDWLAAEAEIATGASVPEQAVSA